MSVSALDHLLLSVGGRPPLAARKRDSHDLLVPFQQRFLLQRNSTKHLRKRQHSIVQKPQAALSLRLYTLKKNAWPRALLTALRVDVDKLDAKPRRSFIAVSRELASDSKVRLFFDGLLLQSTGKKTAQTPSRSLWRLPSPTKVVGKSRAVLQVAIDPSPRSSAVFRPSVGIPIDSEIDFVRSRRKSSRRMSLVTKRSRRCSSYEPRESSQQPQDGELSEDSNHELLRTHSAADLDRVEAAIDAATANAMRVVAAESNAQLSFELMERKASNSVHTAAAWGLDAHSVDLEPSPVNSAGTEDQDELETLRAENAEQKALIRQLLIENRRLLAQQSQQQPQQQPQYVGPDQDVPTSKRKRMSASQQLRLRGISTVSTVSSSSLPLSRRTSLTFDVVDGHETFVDHKFDHLVSEITSELAELLSEDGFS